MLFLQLLVLLFLLSCFVLFFDTIIFLFFCFFCSDINECVRGLHKCSSGAFCNNTKGSYNCTCVGGSHSCSPDAYCNNTKGSYNCTCKPGFIGSGRECEGEHFFENVEQKKADFLIGNFLIKQILRLPYQEQYVKRPTHLLLFLQLLVLLYIYFLTIICF